MNVYRGAAKTKSAQLATNGRMGPAELVGKQPNTPHKTKWGIKNCYIYSELKKLLFFRFGWENEESEENTLFTTLEPHRPTQQMTIFDQF